MNATRAAQIIGLGDSRHTIAQMRFALSLHPWRNDHAANQRLLAAEFALKNWRAFDTARRERREKILERRAPVTIA